MLSAISGQLSLSVTIFCRNGIDQICPVENDIRSWRWIAKAEFNWRLIGMIPSQMVVYCPHAQFDGNADSDRRWSSILSICDPKRLVGWIPTPTVRSLVDVSSTSFISDLLRSSVVLCHSTIHGPIALCTEPSWLWGKSIPINSGVNSATNITVRSGCSTNSTEMQWFLLI